MGKLIFISGVLLCSLSAVAQIQFDHLIEQSVAQQKSSAAEMQQSTHFAEAPEDDAFDTKSSVRMVPAALAAPQATETPKASVLPVAGDTVGTAHNQAPPIRSTATVAEDKDFDVKLRPTGKETAQRYFKLAYEADKIQRAKERAEKRAALKAKKEKLRLAKLEKKEKARLAKQKRLEAKKAKIAQSKKIKKSRSTASIASTNKKTKKKSRSVQTAQN